ncbi:MAG TPA: hypothetical protein VGR09_09960 [Gemmatimonadales bacterium]|nr:hypothetical protein [Gemmatimonadales bacterium]
MAGLDITPLYPRPREDRIRAAVERAKDVASCIAPQSVPFADLMVRAVMYPMTPPDVAMWALHDLVVAGGLIPYRIGEHPKGWPLVNSRYPPAGIKVVKGKLHIDNKANPLWGSLVFVIDHQRMAMFSLSSDNVGDNPKPVEKYRRKLTTEARECIQRYVQAKKSDPYTKMIQVVRRYAEEAGGSAQSIMRTINDNPDQWKQ